MKTDRSSWRQEWRVLLLWLLALLAAFALLAAVTRALAQHHLQRDAEDIALRYADVVAATVPGLDALFAGQRPAGLEALEDAAFPHPAAPLVDDGSD